MNKLLSIYFYAHYRKWIQSEIISNIWWRLFVLDCEMRARGICIRFDTVRYCSNNWKHLLQSSLHSKIIFYFIIIILLAYCCSVILACWFIIMKPLGFCVFLCVAERGGQRGSGWGRWFRARFYSECFWVDVNWKHHTLLILFAHTLT